MAEPSAAADGPAAGGASATATKRLFSGIQPTGEIHIGNSLGAVRDRGELASTCEAIDPVVDHRAVTIDDDDALMRARILDTATVIMARGVTPDTGGRPSIQSAVQVRDAMGLPRA